MGLGAHKLRVERGLVPWLMSEHTPIPDPAALGFPHGDNEDHSMNLAVRRLT